MSIAIPRDTSSRDFILFELRRAPRRTALITALFGVLALLSAHALVLRLPPLTIRFMERAFQIEGLASVLLINDLLAVYFATFFLGLGGLLEATVTAREEGRLEMLLAKPIRGRVFLAARVFPILVSSVLVGTVLAVTIRLTVPSHRVSGDAITGSGVLGSGLCLVGLAVVVLSALLPLFVLFAIGSTLFSSAQWPGSRQSCRRASSSTVQTSSRRGEEPRHSFYCHLSSGMTRSQHG